MHRQARTLTALLCLLLLAGPALADDKQGGEQVAPKQSVAQSPMKLQDHRSFLEKAYDYVSKFVSPKPMELRQNKVLQVPGDKPLSQVLEGSQPKVAKPANAGNFVWEKSVATKQTLKLTSTETDISSATYCEVSQPCPPNGAFFKTFNGHIEASWNVSSVSGANCSNEVVYDFLYGTTNPPTAALATGITARSVTATVPSSNNNITNYWQVRTRNTVTGASDLSDVYGFTPLEQPTIAVGGYLDSVVSQANGGNFTFMIITTDPGIEKVELWFGGVYTADMTNGGGGVWTFNLSLAPNDLPANVTFGLEARAIAYGGSAASTLWPYLFADVPPSPCPNSAPLTSNEELGRSLEKKVAATKDNFDFSSLIAKRIAGGESKARSATRALNEPRIQLAGYWDTKLTAKGPKSGKLTLVAFAPATASGPVSAIEVLFGDKPAGLNLTKGYLGSDDLWALELDLGEGAFASAANTPIKLQLRARDAAGNLSQVWPDFTSAP